MSASATILSNECLSIKGHPEWKLVYYEAYCSESDARRRERKLKDHGNAIRELKKRIGDSLESLSTNNQSGAGRSERGQPTV
jgi:predicted GIY-YIG superfamily endonuclease